MTETHHAESSTAHDPADVDRHVRAALLVFGSLLVLTGVHRRRLDAAPADPLGHRARAPDRARQGLSRGLLVHAPHLREAVHLLGAGPDRGAVLPAAALPRAHEPGARSACPDHVAQGPSTSSSSAPRRRSPSSSPPGAWASWARRPAPAGRPRGSPPPRPAWASPATRPGSSAGPGGSREARAPGVARSPRVARGRHAAVVGASGARLPVLLRAGPGPARRRRTARDLAAAGGDDGPAGELRRSSSCTCAAARPPDQTHRRRKWCGLTASGSPSGERRGHDELARPAATRVGARVGPGPGPRPRAHPDGGALRGLGGVLRLRAGPLPPQAKPRGRSPRRDQPHLDLARGRGGGGRDGRSWSASRSRSGRTGWSTCPAPSESTRVRVVAEQFAWNIHYPGPDGLFGRTDVKLIDLQANPARPRPRGPRGEGRRHDHQPAAPAGGPTRPPHPVEQGRDPLVRAPGDAHQAGRRSRGWGSRSGSCPR